MSFELKLAWKFFRARRRSTARFTAMVAVTGIACGVASLIVVQALTRGFAGEMREKILGHTAHVTVYQTGSREIQNWQIVKRELEKIETVSRVEPTTYESALITGKKTTAYTILRAIDRGNAATPAFENDGRVTNSQTEAQKDKDQSSKTEDQLIEIALGAELAEKTGLQTGDEAEIVLPWNDALPKSATARITETFRTGIYDYDATWIYISPADFALLSEKKSFAPTVFSLSVTDAFASGETARRVRALLPPDFKVVDWQEANRPLFAALSTEKAVSLTIISLIIFIAALNITTTLALAVNERKLDIAVLRACGARGASLILIFLFEGLFLGALGACLGACLGALLCFAGNYFRLVSLPAEVYSLSHVPLALDLGDLLLIAGIAFLLCLAATVYPAWRAARIKPLENLRNI